MESLGIDPKLLLAQIINFALFFYIFRKFLAKPFAKFIADEKNKEEEKEKLMQNLEKQEERLSQEEEKMRVKIKKEADEILDSAKKSAEQLRSKIADQANKEAQEMVGKAKKQIEEEKANLHRDLRDKVVELSFALVNESLKESLSEQTKKDITGRILKNLPKNVKIYEN